MSLTFSSSDPKEALKNSVPLRKSAVKRVSSWPDATKRSSTVDRQMVSSTQHMDPRRQRPRVRLVYGGHDQRVSESHWAIVVALVASLSIVVAFFVFVALAFVTRSSEENHRLERCDTPACRGFVQLLAASMDTSIEPCDNFYRFVCGNWKSSRSVYQEHLSKFFEELATALRDTRGLDNEKTVSGKAARLYAGCESVLLGGNDDIDGFREVLSEAQLAWPKLEGAADVLTTTFRIRKYFDIASLLKITKLAKSAPDSSTESKFLLEPGDVLRSKSNTHRLSCNNKFYNSSTMWTNASTSYEFFDLVLSIVAGPNSSHEFFILHESFVSIGKDFRKAIHPITNRTVLASPSTDTASLSMFTSHFNKTRWSDFFSKNFNTDDAHIVVNVTDVDYLTAFSDLANKWNESVMVWCTSWLAVAEMAPFMSKDIALHRFITEATGEAAPRHCLELTERLLGAATFSAYANKAFTKDVVEEIRASTLALLAPIQAKMLKSTWLISPSIYDIVNATDFFSILIQSRAYQQELDASLTRNNTESIARNWVNAVHLRNELLDKAATFSRTTHLEDVHTEPSYTFFNAGSSTVRLPLYASMLPMYDRGLTRGIRFGTLGVLFAQATFRGLLARVSQGNASHPDDHLRCFSGPSGNGSYCVDYDRAVPLEMLEELVEQVLPISGRNELDLDPRLEEMQALFVSMCYLLCSPEDGRDASAKSKRACNEAVRHSRLFSKAFNCSLGTNMNPPDKCEFF
ncbi:neprilysin-1-like [Dermacentor variabilis]|uniref:neprilysin-1-like n=1 Tax=Dermacentor variabilis TaxID=34621 RepID=UPI003F5C9AF1